MSEDYPYGYKGYPAGLKYPWEFPMPSEKERDRRWQAIRKSMEKQAFDCLIVGAPEGYMPSINPIHYISNFVAFVNHGTFVVFPLEGQPQLGVSTILGPQFLHCASETSWIKEIVAGLHPARDVAHKLTQLKLETGRVGIVGYKSNVFPASVLDFLRKELPSAAFEDATSVLVESMNEVSRNSEEELAMLKKACEILDLSFEAVADAFKPGVKECEVWAAGEQAIIANGGWSGHFMIATSGPAPTFHRAPASHSTIDRGDVAMFEINAVYGGVGPQISYALSLGPPRADVEEMFQLVQWLYDYSLLELEKNRTFVDIERDLVQRIHDAGYEPMTPQIHKFNMSGVMPQGSYPQAGDYFTVHPNICNKEYTAGAKFGDAVRIKRNGKVERLQRTEAKLHVL